MKALVQLFFFVLISSAMYGQDVKGEWSGALFVQGTSFRIVFHIAKEADQYKATMDSPDQNTSGVPVTSVSFNYPNIKLEILPIGMVYEGTMTDNQITGKWMQAGQIFPLILSKTESPSHETK